jgi:predicted GH43/DUF377 family glycosyl hydrolase
MGRVIVRPKNDISNIRLSLERYAGNPILKPISKNRWETKAVFNPAAIYEGGKVHILYRAIGENDVSVLGYASSIDGFTINERFNEPVYVPREPFEGVNPASQSQSQTSGIYVSGGGGMGGCEDPRLTKIDERVYLTYVAYDGYSPPRVALSSICADDFLNRDWNWEKPVLISPPGIVNKNACILPEKIGGKYVIFHRIFPNILIDFVDDLNFDGRTRWLEGQYKIPARTLSSDWDNLKVGCGPPPIKTKDGWLQIYQAVGNNDHYRYKIGAMLFDLSDPTRVLARTKNPILEPDAVYENEGLKRGVVYPCGAALIDDRLFVYYGGADMVACVASVKLGRFLEQLTANHRETAPGRIPAGLSTGVEEGPVPVRGYCAKCRQMQEIKNSYRVVLKNNRVVIQGFCSRCGRKVTSFGKSRPNQKVKNPTDITHSGRDPTMVA